MNLFPIGCCFGPWLSLLCRKNKEALNFSSSGLKNHLLYCACSGSMKALVLIWCKRLVEPQFYSGSMRPSRYSVYAMVDLSAATSDTLWN
jgi:hypothetical protein